MEHHFNIAKKKKWKTKIAFYQFLSWAISCERFPVRPAYSIAGKKNEAILSYLKEKYAPVIKRYETYHPKKNRDFTPRIWVLWWQGIDAAPEIVKCCIQSIKNNAGKYEVVLIDQNNYQKYVTIPKYIIDQLNHNRISITHFSDVLRVSLLSRYGGVWLDATIYMSDRIPDIVFESPFYTNKTVPFPSPYVSKQRWSVFFLAGEPGHIVFTFARDLIYEYFKNETKVIDYFFLDYVIAAGYELVPQIRNAIDSVPFNNEGIHRMLKCIDKKADYNLYTEITNENSFHKLSQKHQFRKTDQSGQATMYQYLLESSLFNSSNKAVN